MTQKIPPFPELLREAENRLSRVLEGRCVISVHRELDEDLKKVIQTIDHEKFRQELWYSRDELDARTKRKGFLCLLASLDGRAAAFDFCYEDDEGHPRETAAGTRRRRKVHGVLQLRPQPREVKNRLPGD